MRKTFGKFLSLFLIATLLIQLVPTTIFATESETTADPNVTDDAMSGYADELESIENPTSSATILFEEESLREENVKHFRMDDGSYIAVQYGTPVHYEENGQWVDYDNTLHEVSTLDGEGVSHYTVTNGDSTRVFAADANAEALLIVQKGDCSLSLTPVEEPDAEIPLVPSEPVAADLMGETVPAETAEHIASITTETTTDLSTEEIVPAPATVLSVVSDGGETFDDPVLADAQPDKIYSSLEYADVINGATIRYENYANTIKESIIISEPQGEYVYSFRMATEDLTPSLQEDGSILLLSSEGNAPYRIPAPYMFDGNDEYSFDAYYTLTPVGNEWILTVTADAAWINAEEREFPVFLDPTVEETAGSEEQICGGFVQKGYPSTPDRTNPDFYVGHSGNANGLIRTYLHVNDLVELPAGCEIYEATISLCHIVHSYRTSGKDIEVGAYEITKAGSLDGSMDPSQWQAWADNLAWNQTINGTTTIDDVILDTQTLGSETVGDYVSWDITPLAFKWYDSENYRENLGIALRVITDDDESTVGSRAAFRGAGNTNYTSGKPRMKISYRNTRGIEDKYTYQTLGVGRAGTSYISDYTLDNTHVVPLFSFPSNVMPFTLSLIYNTSLTDHYFTDKAPHVNTRNYSSMILGMGWKLSVQQTITERLIGNTTYMVYADADGTEHYFRYETDGYRDEDGLGLKITKSGTTYTMTNDADDIRIFEAGYITEERDAYGNALYYCYNGYNYSTSNTLWKPVSNRQNRLTAVYRKNKDSDTLELLLQFCFEDDDPRVSGIIGKWADSETYETRTVTLGIENWGSSATPCYMLTSLTFPDEARMEYSYFKNGEDDTIYYNLHRMRRIYDSEANYGVEFNYSYDKNVCQFYEYIVNENATVYGLKCHAFKRAHSQTAYRYYGKDGEPYMDSDGHLTENRTTDDLLTVVVQDREGRTTGSYTSNYNETEVLGAQVVNYTENSGTSKKNNRITASASSGQQGSNLLLGSSGETGIDSWINAGLTTTEHYLGDKALLLSASETYQQVTLQGGKTYTFSAYIKIPAGTTFSSGGNVHLAFLPLISGWDPLAEGEKLTYSTQGIDKGWARLTATYSPVSNTTCRVAVVKTGISTGNIYADCLQLEEAEATSVYNILDNGSFENYYFDDNGSLYFNGWTYTAPPALATNTTLFGTNAVEFQGPQDSLRLNQSVRLNLPGNTGFLLSGWAKANAKPASATAITETDKPFFSMMIRLYYSDGTSEPFYFPFDPYYNGWQYKQGIVEAKRDKSVTITHAAVVAAYDRNINSVSFDNFSLRVEPVYSYNYNDNGDPISATGTDTGTQTGEYTGVDLTKNTAPNGNITNYTYNDKHSVKTATMDGLTTVYDYDTSGNITKVQTEGLKANSNGTTTKKYITEESILSSDRNFTETTKDQFDNETHYTYNSYDGTLHSVTNAKGVTTINTYDLRNGRPELTYVDSIAAILRTYEQGQLKQLERKTYNHSQTPIYQYYRNTYNPWGQKTSVSVGNIPLVTYEYDDVNSSSPTGGGNRTKATLGNDDSVNYFYDEFDRLTKEVYNDTGRVINYYYNADGALSKLTSGIGNSVDTTYFFEYDSSGRVVRSSQWDNNILSLRTEHTYDEFSRPYTQKWFMDGRTHYEQYRYDDGAAGDGQMTRFRTSTGQLIYYGYDYLKRQESATVKNTAGEELFKTAFAYQNVAGDRTSNRVEFRNMRDSSGNVMVGYKYVYDAVGNITEIRQSTGSFHLLYAYTYDDQNQLTEERHYDGNGDAESNITATYTYTYDTAGNIRSESKLVKTPTEANPNATTTTTKSYTYGNDQWKDLLTAVNGSPILYEGQEDGGPVESGNPILYTNGTKTYTDLTWQHGRQLASITTGGKTSAYAYDAAGIRTEKVVDGVPHTYLNLNGKVVRESFPYGNSTVVMQFIYDNQGKPFSILYSTDGGNSFAQYYYATNAQGDVEGIFFTRKNADTGIQEIHWMGHYTYDAWGNITSITNAINLPVTNPESILIRNPLRYRGYYYDSETGFYYLQSRYYDPANHRFINADCYTSTGQGFIGYNMFAYCNSTPVNGSDTCGTCYHSSDLAVNCHMCQGRPVDENLFSPINGQQECEYADMAYGWGSIAKNGCGPVAIYNALGFLGKRQALSAIVEYLGNSWNGRFLGTMPGEIGDALTNFDVSYERIDNPNQLSSALSEGGMAIIMSWNDTMPHYSLPDANGSCMLYKTPNFISGAHIVLMTHDGNGTYSVYNCYSNRKLVYTFTSFEDFLVEEETYIAGFNIG